jgi:ATP-binding cassette subfamily B protein
MTDATQFDDDENGPLKAPLKSIVAYIWKRWTTYPVWLWTFFTLYTVAISCDLLLPLVSARLIEALSGDRIANADAVWASYWLFAGVALGLYMFRNISVRFWIPLASRNMKSIVVDGFRDVQRFSADWHANNFAGATVRRVSRAMNAYDAISDTIVWFVLPATIVLVGITAITFAKWPLIGLFVATTIGLMLWLNYWTARHYLADDYTQTNAADTRIGASLADSVGSNAAVKAFGAEAREEQRIADIAEDWRWKAERLWLRSTNAWIIQNILLFVFQAGLVGLVVMEWSQGRATSGDAAFAVTSYFLVSGYLRTLGENIRMLQKGVADIADVVAYEAQEAEVVDAPDARDFAPSKGEIRFENVAFGYRNQDAKLYKDFSLVIAPGETAALVGPTGAGKSTFVKLVQRLYDVDAGAIRIDGQDVRAVKQASLRRFIATVPQDPALFHRSLFENISYGRPDATLADVEAAAKRARAHDFIVKLPKGYDTEVGERGVKLSGGERQRVALARAFLADAPILILDEATSSLDTETERDVQAAMSELKEGRTTIVIAHRLSTVRNADRILVFERGAIVEQGRHAELVQQDGLYAKLNRLAQGDLIAAE